MKRCKREQDAHTTIHFHDSCRIAIAIISISNCYFDNYIFCKIFLGCNLSELIELKETEIDPKAARIYPIIFRDRLITIIEIPGQDHKYR